MAQLIDASDALKRLIAEHDLTQAEVAEAARVTVVTANRWVNGKQRADADTIYRAIRAFGDDPAAYGVTLRKPLGDEDASEQPEWAVAMEQRLREDARRQHEETLAELRNIINAVRARR